MQFNKITVGSPAFQNATATFDSLVDRFDYDGMATAFNELKAGEILSFEYKKGKAAIVSQQLEKRGLVRNTDFSVRSAGNEGTDTATVLIKRESDKTAGAVVHAQRGRKPKAATEASTPASSAPAASGEPAKPAKPAK